jgi:hypothetical protein
MNKYEKHYRSIQTSDLLRKLLEHKLQTQPLGKEWADALVTFLIAQNPEGSYRQIFVRIQDTDAYQLGEDAQELQKLIDDLQAEEHRDNPFIIDPMKIVDAGKNLKMMARLLTVLIIAAMLAGIISEFSDYGTRMTLFGLLLLIFLLTNVVFLGLIYATGSSLQESVRRKKDNR